MLKKFQSLCFILGLSLSSTANAVPVTFFGEDIGLGEFTRLSAHPIADGAQSSFAAGVLPSVLTENFEGLTATNPPTLTTQNLLLSFGPNTAILNGDGLLVNSPTGTDNPLTPPGPTPAGVYPISGDHYFLSFGTFDLTFSTPQAAFSFYAVDVGDNGGQMRLEFLLAKGGSIFETVPHTVNATGGSIIFFGLIDEENPFTGVRFLGSATSDGFAFDDMTIGQVEQVLPAPEPTTLYLLALGLMSIGFSRRKASKPHYLCK